MPGVGVRDAATCVAFGDQSPPRPLSAHPWALRWVTGPSALSPCSTEDLGGISSWADGAINCLDWTLYSQESHLP